MECKSAAAIFVVAFQIKIETYWNVNQGAYMPFVSKHWIKIETYWNVNPKRRTRKSREEVIKIETYWNVNKGVYVFDFSDNGLK